MNGLDYRLHAYRPDLADERLRGQVHADRFISGKPRRIITHFADILRQPEDSAPLERQVLYGETVLLFDEAGGFAWIQRDWDGYVGYVRSDALGPEADPPTHLVSAPRTFLYPEPDLKAPRCGYRSMGSRVTVVGEAETRGTKYALLDSGEAMIARHLCPISEPESDFVDVAARLLHAPYLWGGNTAFGLDCAGLIQLSMMMSGRPVLADSDMQAETIGELIDPGGEYENLRRGDLVFWKGHMGILEDGESLLHANGHTMDVAREPLRQAIERIAYLYSEPRCFRRP